MHSYFKNGALVPLACGVLLTNGGRAQTPMAQGGTAADAVSRMKVPDGFSVDLIAAEPDIVQPIAMCIDARGRIWVAEGMTYPKRAPEGKGTDRIVILEDADSDGSFETRKIFAEGLNLVSGIETGFGGLFVGAAPYLMFIADADGNDVPDSPPRILLDGWGFEDTHETLNSFIWGSDGWLYGCHGVFTHSKVGKPGTPDPQRVPINAGIWRYHPVSEAFEVFAHGTSNPWGLDFNDWGEAFIEACVIPHLWHIIPGGFYQRQAGSHFNPHIYDPIETIADHRHWVGNFADHAHWGHENAISKGVSDAGGGHAHCGFAICLSDEFPAEMRGSALFFNIHGHRMNRDRLERHGSGWIGKHAPDVMLSNDQWFLGVALEPGPAGALYFTDWQDQTSCHRPDPQRWDRGNGRVYRLRCGGVKPWKGNLTKSSDLELAKLQAGRDEWQLRTARRLLQERTAKGAKLDQAATSFLTETLKTHADETRRLRALWCLASCGLLEESILPLDDPNEWLRSWSVRLASQSSNPIQPSRLLERASAETSPVVLLSFCSALQKLPRDLALDLSEKLAPRMAASDPNLTRMFWFGFEVLVPLNEKQAVNIALSCPDERLLQWTARRLASPDELIAALPSAGSRTASILDALTTRLDHKPNERLSPTHLAALAKLASDADPTLRKKAGSLVSRSGGKAAVAKLWSILENRKATTPERLEALRLLEPFLKRTDINRLSGLTDDPALRLAVLTSNPTLLDHPATGDRIAGFTPDEKSAVCRIAAREDKAARLIEWLAAKKMLDKDVPADAVARLRDVKDPALQKEVILRWGEATADESARRALITSWRDKLTPEVLSKADLPKGRAVFDRTCSACHKLFGEGASIGPELTGGERGKLDHWLDNILDPNALIGQGYALHQLEKTDGSSITGMLAGENDQEFLLRMVGVETRVPKKDVKSNKPLGISMMPEGLLNGMSLDEVRDLIAYLMAPAQVEKR